jgi:hypothetical protein
MNHKIKQSGTKPKAKGNNQQKQQQQQTNSIMNFKMIALSVNINREMFERISICIMKLSISVKCNILSL